MTNMPGKVSPAWNKKSPGAKRLSSPKRRTRSISAGVRIGNIWLNRDARAAF
jgi:hypothetical protein